MYKAGGKAEGLGAGSLLGKLSGDTGLAWVRVLGVERVTGDEGKT